MIYARATLKCIINLFTIQNFSAEIPVQNKVPTAQVYAQKHQRARTICTVENIDYVTACVRENTSTSICHRSHELNIFHTSLRQISRKIRYLISSEVKAV